METVYKFKTKNKEGFTQSEIETLLNIVKSDHPNINIAKFNNALRGNTCIMVGDEIVIYHCDVENAFRCGITDRDLGYFEWD